MRLAHRRRRTALLLARNESDAVQGLFDSSKVGCSVHDSHVAGERTGTEVRKSALESELSQKVEGGGIS